MRTLTVLVLAAWLLTAACQGQAADDVAGISWEEIQELYPGVTRDSLNMCTEPGQEGCIPEGEFNYVPRLFGSEEELHSVHDEGAVPLAGPPKGEKDDGSGGNGGPRDTERPRRPSSDELYDAAVQEALTYAESKPLEHFVSGTSFMTSVMDGPRFVRTFALRRRGWDHHMHLQAAMGSEGVLTAQELLPLRPGRSAPLALVTGDADGLVSIFAPSGELLGDFDSEGGTVTALAAIHSRASTVTLITGHANGFVRTHLVELHVHRPAEADADNDSSAAGAASYTAEVVWTSQLALAPPEPQQPAAAAAEQCTATGSIGGSPAADGNGAEQGACTAADSDAGTGSGSSGGESNSDGDSGGIGTFGGSTGQAEGAAPVRHIVTIKNGREWRFAAIHRSGDISVWREDGRRLQTAHCPAEVLAARWSEASITMLTPVGGAILLTHAMPGAPQPIVRLRSCAGLGGDGDPVLAAAAFDVQHPVRAYGATGDGRLLHLSLGHAKTFQNCQVRRAVGMRVGPASTLAAGVTLTALQQHVVAASTAWISVFDVSQPSVGPRHLFEDSLPVIMAGIRLKAPVMAPPAVSAGRSGPVALGFGSGVVATYEPALLHFEHEPDFSFFEAWSRPLVTVAMVLIAALQVARARRRARQRRLALQSGNGGKDLLQGDLQAALGVGPGGAVSAAGRLPGDPPLPQGRDVLLDDVIHGGGEVGSDSDDFGSEDVVEVAAAQAEMQEMLRRRRTGQ